MYFAVLYVMHRTFNSVAVKRKQVQYCIGWSAHARTHTQERARGDVITLGVKQRDAGYLPLWF